MLWLLSILALGPVSGTVTLADSVPGNDEVYCAGTHACDDAGETAYDRPRCAEYERHNVLLNALEGGDRGVLPLLENAWKSTENHYERNRLGRALLGRVPDAAIWRELESKAAIAVDHPDGDHSPLPDFVAWCAKRGVTAEEYWNIAFDALQAAAPDKRAAPLLAKALNTLDARLIKTAITGFGLQRAEEMLPHIDRALTYLPPGQRDIAFALREFASPAADTIAARHLDEAELWAYEQDRDSRRQP